MSNKTAEIQCPTCGKSSFTDPEKAKEWQGLEETLRSVEGGNLILQERIKQTAEIINKLINFDCEVCPFYRTEYAKDCSEGENCEKATDELLQKALNLLTGGKQ